MCTSFRSSIKTCEAASFTSDSAPTSRKRRRQMRDTMSVECTVAINVVPTYHKTVHFASFLPPFAIPLSLRTARIITVTIKGKTYHQLVQDERRAYSPTACRARSHSRPGIPTMAIPASGTESTETLTAIPMATAIKAATAI